MTAIKNDRFFVAFDKTPLHYIETRDPAAAHRASAILVHGAGEHAGRYDDFAAFLAARGIAGYALNLRGYGKSGGYPAYVRSFDDYVKDIGAIVQKLKNEGEPRIFLFGHSMGGLIAAYAAAHGGFDLKGLVLSSPCFNLAFDVPGHLKLLAEVTSVLFPTFLHATKMKADWLTHDPEMISKHMLDKQIRHFISSRLYCLIIRQMARAEDLAKAIRCPVLVCQAGDDMVIDKKASRRFFDGLGPIQKEFKLYEGFFHEILNETRRQEPYSDIANWLSNLC